MKIIIFLESIVTIILVTSPVFELTRLSANDRVNNFVKLNDAKKNVINEYLTDFTLAQSLDLLNNYVLNEKEMKEFAMSVNESGDTPEWAISHKLKNPKLYQLLRYDTSVEFITSNPDELIERATNLQTTVFQNSPQVSIRRLCNIYLAEYLNELISLDDYYAINVLLQNNNQITLENPAARRMKKALYNLAIRQYSPAQVITFSPIICYNVIRENLSFIQQFKEGNTYEFSNFMFCDTSDMFRKEKLSSTVNIINTSNDCWISYRFGIDSPLKMVNLEEFTRNDGKKWYALFPKTIVKIFKDPIVRNTNYGIVAFVRMKIINTPHRSLWLTNMANKIEEYEEQDQE